MPSDIGRLGWVEIFSGGVVDNSFRVEPMLGDGDLG